MIKEVLQYLAPKKNQNFIDCTLGLGGHAKAILEKTGPKGKILAIEQSSKGLVEAKKNLEKYKDRIVFICDNFRNLEKISKDNKFGPVSGILFDLGLASWQISDPELGLTFQENYPLDMRIDDKVKYTASDILNTYGEKQLANLFFQLGDVRNSRQIAERIVQIREKNKFENSGDLIEAIGTKNPKVLAPIFQALRIEVNYELENLLEALPAAYEILAPKGKIVVISYHSGEDRIAKNFFRSRKSEIKILTKKPIEASKIEIKENPRSRSAKLRAGEKI